MICPRCMGEGGRPLWIDELGDEEFVHCDRCDGHGWLEEHYPAPLSDPESFDVAWERMVRANEEWLRGIET